MAQINRQLSFFCKGFGLVEILVALTIFSIVLVPLMARQLKQSQQSYQNYFKSIAVTQAQSMLERLRANHSDQARRREYLVWNKWNQQLLPQGHGSYTCRPYDHRCWVSIKWWSNNQQAYALSAHIH